MKCLCIGLFVGTVGSVLALQFPAAAAAGTKEKVVYSFRAGSDGFWPYAALIDVKGTLYGTTSGGAGTVFALDPQTGAEKVLHGFGSGDDGAKPYAGLMDVKGTLYGTTYEGGTGPCSGGCGTVFSLDPKTGAEKVLYSFCTQGECSEGAEGPYAGLIYVQSTLYGTKYGDGDGGVGTVFSLDLSTGRETVRWSFTDGGDGGGAWPYAGLIDVNGTLYGTASGGGTYGYGTVFAFDPKSNNVTQVYSFCSQPDCSDGNEPFSSLIYVNNKLYGTTEYGGSSTGCHGGCGTVFALDLKTGAETVLHSFGSGTDGVSPIASLMDVKGTLYGTTYYGGSNTNCSYGCGTVFSLDLSTGAETVLHSFGSGTDGASPYANLIDVNGTLYGTTEYGGSSTGCHGGCGTVFALKTNLD
jgi:uncharacterized repeat protein (TIGR03803 family)